MRRIKSKITNNKSSALHSNNYVTSQCTDLYCGYIFYFNPYRKYFALTMSQSPDQTEYFLFFLVYKYDKSMNRRHYIIVNKSQIAKS